MAASPSPVAGKGTIPSSKAPISLRLYKVLGTNYDDPGVKEALVTLSELYDTQRETQVNKRVDSDSEEEDESSSPEKTPVLSRENVAEKARKNFRRDVGSKLADGSRKFLQAFGEVDQKLDVLQSVLADMRTTCDNAQAQLRSTGDSCSVLLNRANRLHNQRADVETRQTIVSLLLERFTLTEEEVQAVVSRDVPVGPRLFEAMTKIEQIRADATVLLSGEEGQTQAGLDIMADTASTLEQGYQKLLRGCCLEFSKFGRGANLEVSDDTKEAVRRLQKRPELLEEALLILSETRHNTLLQNFLVALTKGGPAGVPRPIELHAHDPIRYVGDMLAWVHQTIAGEHEFLEALFDIKQDKRMVGSVRKFNHDNPQAVQEALIGQLLDTAVDGLAKPLKLRILQTIKSQEGSITSYKLANLLQFYAVTMSRTVGESAFLSATLHELTEVAHQVFFEGIEAQSRSLLRFLHPPNEDLSPPLTLYDHAQILREMMAVYDSSLLGDEDEPNRREGFTRILDILIPPIIEMCEKMADLKGTKDPRKDAWDRHIFLINCLEYLESVLHPFAFTMKHLGNLEALIDTHAQGLVDSHFEQLLVDSGLSPIIAAIDNHSADTPLSHIPQASSQSLTAAVRQFSTFLSTLDVLSSPRLQLLTAPALPGTIHRRALTKIALAYEKICIQVKRPENKYEFVSTILGSQRPFGQTSTLWQLLGIQEPVR
ncbi:oligomeric complex COG6 [Sistotremastrum niveocremeum HHB9708]|uniref:Conserved oligomeric Golgi complex subunit 6 n=1 Tax=Sistotremastrum niveocremeum HHB9708 TaxID=1314777 RepID=A0A165AJK7_9AGAM|nr:oligomeric complex COG6 [Sistotremastrum niveocremeum HHB9708]